MKKNKHGFAGACAMCRTPFFPDQHYCFHCGAELHGVGVPVCHGCHGAIWLRDHYCRHCGIKKPSERVRVTRKGGLRTLPVSGEGNA